MARTTRQATWILEVVRGRHAGVRYAVGNGDGHGDIVLGNALADTAGIDLTDQEPPNSPRRMAPRQAALAIRGQALEIRDLESPGGTFVNRQRLLAGQVRTLQPGDIIQLGGVQLQVLAPAPAAADATARQSGSPTTAPGSARPAPPATAMARSASPPPTTPAAASAPAAGQLSIPYTIPGAGTCRTWEDFLTLSAQRWALVRDELTSGRITEHLRRVQRFDLAPRAEPGQNADEQLDGWLARLPAARSTAPELDVHPQLLLVRGSSGGGLIRQKIQVINVGYRMLRGTARVECPVSGRIRLPDILGDGSFVAVDQTEIPLDIELGDDVARLAAGAAIGAVVIESNGGTKRVEVRLERAATPQGIPEFSAERTAFPLNDWARPLRDQIAALPLARRLVLAPVLFMAFRFLVGLSRWVPVLSGSRALSSAPNLEAIAVLLALVGTIAGAFWALRSGEGKPAETLRDAFCAGFAGAILGVFAAAVAFALIQSVESVIGTWSSSSVATYLLWGVLGVGLALVSWQIVPFSFHAARQRPETTS